MNLFTQRGAAFVLGDGAYFHLHSAVLGDIETKILSSSKLRAALGFSGAHVTREFRELLLQIASQGELLSRLPEMAEIVQARWLQCIPGLAGPPQFQIFVALHCLADRVPKVLLFSTDDGGHGQYRPGLHPVSSVVTPRVDQAAWPRRDLNDPGSFDPAKDAVGLLEAQRAAPWPTGGYQVGGFVELVKVGRWGIRRKVLHRWPHDKVGRPIEI